ncbi:unnamed protein product [Leuciscus chuanchicus]
MPDGTGWMLHCKQHIFLLGLHVRLTLAWGLADLFEFGVVRWVPAICNSSPALQKQPDAASSRGCNCQRHLPAEMMRGQRKGQAPVPAGPAHQGDRSPHASLNF